MRLKLIIALLLSTSISLTASHQESASINRTTHLIFRRFYFIARLEKTIALLAKINQTATHAQLKRITESLDPSLCEHTLTHYACRRINESKSITPLLAVWDEFASYKSLESEIVIGKEELFVKEFGQQVFNLTRSALAEIKGNNVFKNYSSAQIKRLCPERLIDLIDIVVSFIERTPFSIQESTKLLEINNHATADDINLRFYYIQRLSNAIDTLMHFKAKHPEMFDLAIQKTARTLRRNATLKVAAVRSTLDYIIQQESAEPIFAQWQDFRQYKKIQDQDFASEFCTLLLSALKTIQNLSDGNSSNNLQDILENATITDVINTIDIITGEIEHTLQDFQEENTSIKEWIKKKWWVPLYTLATITLKVIEYFGSKKPSPSLDPKKNEANPRGLLTAYATKEYVHLTSRHIPLLPQDQSS